MWGAVAEALYLLVFADSNIYQKKFRDKENRLKEAAFRNHLHNAMRTGNKIGQCPDGATLEEVEQWTRDVAEYITQSYSDEIADVENKNRTNSGRRTRESGCITKSGGNIHMMHLIQNNTTQTRLPHDTQHSIQQLLN